MGLIIHSDLDTNLGASEKVYIRIENLTLNRTFGKVKVAVSYWIDQDHSEIFKHSLERCPKGQISNKIIFYPDETEDSLGEEITLPVLFELNLTKPKTVYIPIYETKTVTEEVPYISFDELGRRSTAYRTVTRNVKEKVGEKPDVTQVLDFDIEKTLISWCYGQIKAHLAELIPADLLEDN